MKSDLHSAATAVMEAYPRIFFACHRQHRRDPRTRRLVSEHDARIIDHLDQVHPMTLSSLSSHMGVTPGTMSVAVTRLVKQGYIRSRRDPEDARRVGLRLTPAGARLREAQSVLDRDLVEDMLSHLPASDLPVALHGLKLLARAAGVTMAARRGGGFGGRTSPGAPPASPRRL